MGAGFDDYNLSLVYHTPTPSIDLRNTRVLFDNSFLHDGHIFFADSLCFLSLLDDGADEPSKVKATGVRCFMLVDRVRFGVGKFRLKTNSIV